MSVQPPEKTIGLAADESKVTVCACQQTLFHPAGDWLLPATHTQTTTPIKELNLNDCSANRRPVITLEEARSDTDRAEIKGFICRQFAFHFGAEASIEPPILIGAWNAQRQLVGALGLRTHLHGFFSQKYLSQPLAQVMHDVLVRDIAATEVVEVVHLAVASPAIITPLLEALADHLSDAGFRFLVCTATRCLQRFFRKRGWSITTLAKAEPNALGAEAAAWGAYYAQEPAVIVGDIAEARRLAHTREAERISA